MVYRLQPMSRSVGRFTAAPLHRSLLAYKYRAVGRPATLLPKLSVRTASQWGGRPRPQYSRFARAEGLYGLWLTSPAFRIGLGAVGVAGGVFYYSNLEYVPVTGRRRFNFISPQQEAAFAQNEFSSTMEEFHGRVLSPDHPYTRIVNRVVARLVPHAGLPGLDWEVRVIDEKDEKNAFVIPGGKIFVFSGILPVCAGDDGLAHVLGHEIGHTVAHHTAEKLSKSGPILGVGLLFSLLFDVSGSLAKSIVDIAFNKTNSRTQESEADYIGMVMASKACYDPQAAIGLWQRMAAAEHGAPPQFLSTHPASKNRIINMERWLPEAREMQTKSECGSTIGFGKHAL